MNELYKYVNIPNLGAIQEELLHSIDHNYETNTHAFSYPPHYMQQTCPKFMLWLQLRCKLPIRVLRFYVTSPYDTLLPHIDGGGKDPVVPFGLNIPVYNCKNTLMTWYTCDDNNKINDTPAGYYGGTHPKDISQLRPIESLELIRPCFTNNSVMHGVTNPNNTYRVMFTVRWILSHKLGRTIEDCIRTDGLF